MRWLDHIRADQPATKILACGLLMFAVGWFFYVLYQMDSDLNQ